MGCWYVDESPERGTCLRFDKKGAGLVSIIKCVNSASCLSISQLQSYVMVWCIVMFVFVRIGNSTSIAVCHPTWYD